MPTDLPHDGMIGAMRNDYGVIAALLVTAGTAVQAVMALRDLRTAERDALGTFWAAEYLRTEIGWWRPRKRLRRNREVRRLLRDSPEDRAMVNRVQWTMRSWGCLTLGSFLALLATLGVGS